MIQSVHDIFKKAFLCCSVWVLLVPSGQAAHVDSSSTFPKTLLKGFVFFYPSTFFNTSVGIEKTLLSRISGQISYTYRYYHNYDSGDYDQYQHINGELRYNFGNRTRFYLLAFTTFGEIILATGKPKYLGSIIARTNYFNTGFGIGIEGKLTRKTRQLYIDFHLGLGEPVYFDEWFNPDPEDLRPKVALFIGYGL